MNSSGSLVCSFLLLHPPVTPRKTAAAALWPCKHLRTCLALPCLALSCLALPCFAFPLWTVYKDTSLLVSDCISEVGGMGMLRCHDPRLLELPPSNWDAPKVLNTDFMQLLLAGEKG